MSASPSPTDRLAIVSDEVSPDFAQVLAVCLPLGIRAYELRALAGGRVPFCEPSAVEQVRQLAHRHQLTLLGISPGFFKLDCADPRCEQELSVGFDAAFALLERLRMTRMTVFSFTRTSATAEIPSQVFERLGRALERCRQAGVEMLIENVPSCWGNTGRNLGRLAEALGVGLTWDPGNCEASGQSAFSQDYAFVRDHIRHLHLKNWSPGLGYTALLDGQADLAGQIRALRQDGYRGYYCLEPHHWQTGAEAARDNTAQFLQIIQDTRP